MLYLNHIQYFSKYGDHCERNASIETTTKSTVMLFDKAYFHLQKKVFLYTVRTTSYAFSPVIKKMNKTSDEHMLHS